MPKGKKYLTNDEPQEKAMKRATEFRKTLGYQTNQAVVPEQQQFSTGNCCYHIRVTTAVLLIKEMKASSPRGPNGISVYPIQLRGSNDHTPMASDFG